MVTVDEAYEVLGIVRGTSEAKLRRAYLRISLLVHPDKSSAHADGEAFKRLNEAWSVLKDNGIVALDEAIAVRGPEIEKLETEFGELEKKRLAREAQEQMLNAQRTHDFHQREERRAADKTNLSQEEVMRRTRQYMHGRPLAVTFDGKVYYKRESTAVLVAPFSDTFIADNGSKISYCHTSCGWVLEAAAAASTPRFAILRGSPHPFNTQNKGKYKWAVWQTYEQLPNGAPGHWVPREDLNSRAVGQKELRQKHVAAILREEAEQQAAMLAAKAEEAKRMEELKRQQEEDELKRKRMLEKQDWMARLQQRPRALGYTGSTRPPQANREQLEAQKERERELEKRLRADWNWNRGGASEDLQEELAVLRYATRCDLLCEDDFLERLKLWVPESLPALDAVRDALFEQVHAIAEEFGAIWKADPSAKTLRVLTRKVWNRPFCARKFNICDPPSRPMC
jgi:hypothetical protein